MKRLADCSRWVTHLLRAAGDNRSACGARVDALLAPTAPHAVVLASFVDDHREGRRRAGRPDLVVCEACEAAVAGRLVEAGGVRWVEARLPGIAP